MPAYEVEKASAEDAWKVNEILEQERDRRELEFDKFDQQMQKYGRLVIEQVKKDIKGFERYGLEIDEAVIEQPFAVIENETTPLKILADRRYIQTDPGMKAILKLEEGPEKSRRLQEFSNEIVQEGCEKYYDQLGHNCTTVFSLVGSIVKRQVDTRSAEMAQCAADIAKFSQDKAKQEQQYQEIQVKLERLQELKKLVQS